MLVYRISKPRRQVASNLRHGGERIALVFKSLHNQAGVGATESKVIAKDSIEFDIVLALCDDGHVCHFFI